MQSLINYIPEKLLSELKWDLYNFIFGANEVHELGGAKSIP